MYLVRRNLTAAVSAWLIVASALPAAAASTPGSATARPAPAAATGIAVSKPLRAAVWTGFSDPAPAPVCTCQDATSVAPFQLA